MKKKNIFIVILAYLCLININFAFADGMWDVEGWDPYSSNSTSSTTTDNKNTGKFGMSTQEFDAGMEKGIEYFNQGLYYEAKDEFTWFKDYNYNRMNDGQRKYVYDYLNGTINKIDELNTSIINDSRVYKFSDVSGYNGQVYCRYDSNILGGVNEDICNQLPYGMYNLGCIYSFVCYDGYIYYLTGVLGNDNVRCSIYRCNMDGTNNVYIADNAINGSNCYIIDNVLYYETGYINSISHALDESGIGKINLVTGEYNEIYRINKNLRIKYCDNSLIYLSQNGNYFCIDTDGNYITSLSAENSYIINDVMYNGYSYKMYDGAVYKYDSDGNSTWIFNAIKRIENNTFTSYSGQIKNVINNKFYYTRAFTRYSPYPFNVFLFRCNVDGSNTELVGAYFSPTGI